VPLHDELSNGTMSNTLEIWASPDPTVARIDERRTRDQLHDTGHERRDGDIDLLAELGVSATRYPVLWEKVAPHDSETRDYAWADRRLRALAERGIEPIVTLLHHGSGPRYTSLVDPAFPRLFAEYAAATARRFPWVKRWTPVNEPLTTARFSTLYGHWYPNGILDHAAFGRAIVNEMLGFALAAERIRDVIPDATFLLTEDLQSYSAGDEAARRYAQHSQERAYLSCELLQGRIVDGHPMHAYLRRRCGITDAELAQLARRATAPDVMGWNYYPYSERHILTGGVHGYGNLPIVDFAPERLDMQPLLRAAYQRLGLPMALSEVHTFGTEYERARWLLARHADALQARADGVPVIAFGAWAAFGLVDWCSLLCGNNRVFEDGIYTCAGPHATPQRTLVADAVSALARGERFELPADSPAWWELGCRTAA
jgi:dTDP-4-dehydrorhamnose reductase